MGVDEMNIDELIDMSEAEYARVVIQAAKRRVDFPLWWKAVLRPELIDATEGVLRDAMEDAKAQALAPERYPQAASFVRKMRSVLAEVKLARIVGVE